MNMVEILNDKFAEEIEIEILKNHEYIKADKEIHKFISKEFSKEKANRLDELLGIITRIVSKVYAEEGIKIGAKSMVALFLG